MTKVKGSMICDIHLLSMVHIRESVDSLCRDGADTQYVYTILKQKPHNFTTNMLKAYLHTQASSLSAFVINKTHIVTQKPRGRQLNAKVCGSKNAIFLILLLQTTMFNNDILKTA